MRPALLWHYFEGGAVIFLLMTAVILPALILRACRPGHVPRWRMTWFDIPREK